jgi:hypothetical protein
MKQLFFSHNWGRDNLDRDNHDRVRQIAHKIALHGWSIWLDESEMVGNIDACMAKGIDDCDCVIVCITESYCRKINETARNPRKRDNCLKEWNYACNRGKLMIPIIMEPYMLDPSKWPSGIVPLHLGSTLYLDASNDDIVGKCIFSLNRMLHHYGVFPVQPILRVKKVSYKSRFYIRRKSKTLPNILREVRL